VGLLWRLFAPKPLKRARRPVRKAALKTGDAVVRPSVAVARRRGVQRHDRPGAATDTRPAKSRPGTSGHDARPAWMVDGMRASLVERWHQSPVT